MADTKAKIKNSAFRYFLKQLHCIVRTVAEIIRLGNDPSVLLNLFFAQYR